MAADDGSSGSATSPFQQVVEAAESVARILSVSITALKEADAFVRHDFPATPDVDRMIAAAMSSNYEEVRLVASEVIGQHALAPVARTAERALENATGIAASAREARSGTVPGALRELASAKEGAEDLATNCDTYLRFIETVKFHLYNAEGRHQRRSAEDGAESSDSGSRLRLRSLLALEQAGRHGQGLPDEVTHVTRAVSAAMSAVKETQAT